MDVRTHGGAVAAPNHSGALITGRARKAQTAAELEGLARRLAAWAAERVDLDDLHQHRTQIDSIKSFVSHANTGLCRSLAGAALEDEPLDAYEECRRQDLRAVWLERVWEFFRDKLDQRDRADYRDALLAADQVVWSCHAPPLERARMLAADGGVMAPSVVPLPFIESRYALEAFPSSMLPPDLTQDAGFIAQSLERLPMGLVRLPPSCVRAPWCLVLVAHEVGHNLEEDLSPELKPAFKEAVREAAGSAGDTEESSWWARWAPEVFADVVSVLLAGPWALRALVEVELRAPQEMLARRSQYPPAVVRLKLLESVAARAGLDAAWVMGLLPEAVNPDDPAVARDRGVLDAVVDAALAPLPGIGASLLSICNVRTGEFERSGDVDRWAAQLAGPDAVPTGSGPRAARLMACAALAAWAAPPPGETLDERRARETRLAQRALEAIAASRDGTFRAEQPAPPLAGTAGDDLAAALLAADDPQLMGTPGA